MYHIEPTFYNSFDSSTNMINMIKSDKYSDTLFIFNDNIYQYGADNFISGGGNACLRPYKINSTFSIPDNYKRSWGIPTGPNFNELTDEIKEIIDYAINDIKDILKSGKFTRVIYSGETKDNQPNGIPSGRKTHNNHDFIGTSIFICDDDVKEYIVDSMYNLIDNLNK